MTTVHKYVVPLDADEISIEMPWGAEILTFQTQHDCPFLWARVDTGNSMERRRFRIVGTGHPLDESAAKYYIGTVQMRGGALVLHLFESRRA